MFILTVKELFTNIKINLEGSYPFVVVKGTVTQYKFDTKKGHYYFTLSDVTEDKCTISCVCWQTKLNQLTINPNKINILKQEVYIKGYIQLYQNTTKICLIVIDILNLKESQTELLKKEKEEKLKNEGYFDDKHKKPLPKWCDKIGIITSKDSNAKEDIINSIQKRFPVKILLYNSYTQGNLAVNNIIEGINFFNDMSINEQPKAILITRGGGSNEDLEIFNEESLIITIFKSKIPIVTAIGHSKDITLSDCVADSYAITPTAAAELLISTTYKSYKYNLKQIITQQNKALLDKINILTSKKQVIEAKILNPKWIISNKENQIQEIHKKCKSLVLKKYNIYTLSLKKYQNELNCSTSSLFNQQKILLLQITTTFFTLNNTTINLYFKLSYTQKSLIKIVGDIFNNKLNNFILINNSLKTIKPNLLNQKILLQ